MKKLILTFLVTCVTSIGINQLISNTNTNHTTKIEETLNLNKNDHIITQLNQEYDSRTKALNQTIKNNLIDSITLINNEITINYQNLNTKLYSEAIYQILLSSEYLEALKTQYQLNLISFDYQNHINFNNTNSSIYSADVWTETHWYWFPYWRLHFSHNAITTIIKGTEKLGGISTGTITAITNFILKFFSSWVIVAIAAAVAALIVANYFIILSLQNYTKGGWIGVIAIIPGIDWGRN